MFEKSFCDELLEELEHFEGSPAPKGRPNTMNHYGVTYGLAGGGAIQRRYRRVDQKPLVVS